MNVLGFDRFRLMRLIKDRLGVLHLMLHLVRPCTVRLRSVVDSAQCRLRWLRTVLGYCQCGPPARTESESVGVGRLTAAQWTVATLTV